MHPKKLRSLLLPILLIVTLIAGFMPPLRSAAAINTPWLSVSGRYIKDPNGNTVILRGVSLIDVSVADSRDRNARQLIDMATDEANGWYARVVRLPVYPDSIDYQPGWNADPDAYFNNHLNPAVQECVARQVYCIIDWHYIKDYNTSAVDTATRNFWSYVAPKYKDVPNVIFELYNEPINPDNWSTWKSAAQPWVNIIRAAAPNNLILIGGPRWSQNVAEAATNPFSGNNLAYVAHIYPEHGGQSTWDSWFGNSSSTVPYFITEWGWQQGGNTPTSGTQSGYGVPFSNYLASKGVSWTAWVFDIYWQPIMFDEGWNLLGGEAYMGQFTKDLLYQYRNNNLPGTPTTVTPTTVTPTTVTPTTVTPTTPVPPGGCKVDYTANSWNNGFTADIKITNNSSSAINGWTLTYSYANGQQITSSWNATVSQSGANVTASNPSSHWNGKIAANGGSVSFGVQGTHSGTNQAPTSFALNGATCGGTVTVTPTTVTPTTVTPTTVTPTTVTPTTVTPTTVTPTTVTPTTVTPTTPVPGTCQVAYTANSWGNGFTADIKITNNSSSAIQGWTLTYSYANGQQITSSWNATVSQSGANVTASNPTSHWNGNIPANGGSVSFGFQGTHGGTNTTPASFTLNGTACNGGTVTVTPTTVTPTNVTPTTVTPTTVTPTTAVPTTAVPTTAIPTTAVPGTHLTNPFQGAQWYLNPDYVASVQAAAAAQGGTLGAQMAKVAQYPTFVWLDSIDAVNGTNGYARSLAGHLDAALAQGANLIGIVIYDLPNRDCSALASNGELLIAQDGFNRYKTEYIDVIYSVISQAKYSGIRIVAVIEPDSLPNLVTNLNSFPKCQEANGPGGYVEATRYTLNKLHPIFNFYAYIDIAHHGWLGWDSNFTPAVTLIANMIKGTTAGVSSVDGFITNTANATALQELYHTANQQINGQPARSASFHEWNQYIDELSFATAWKTAMQAQGLPATSTNMLIDTSRNGWGGSSYDRSRPTGPSTSTDLNTFVDESRIDRRIAKGNWCNQASGIGERPTANTGNVFQAYVWVKPPGESDGSSSLIPTGPDNPGGKGFDRMCDPTYTGNALNNNHMSGALPNAPVSGRWFQDAFVILVQNAYPPLQP